MAVQSTTFLDLWRDRLHRELGSEDTTELFTEARRKAAVNEGALEWVKQTESYQRQARVTFSDGDQEKDLEAVAFSPLSDDDFLWVAQQGVEWEYVTGAPPTTPLVYTYRAGEDFPRRDIPVLNRESPGWRSATATQFPESWYLRTDGGSTYFGLSSPAAVAVGEGAFAIIPYVAKPLTLTGDTEVPYSVSADALEVLEPWLQAIVNYAAAVLEPLRKNYQGEQRQRTLFAAQVADYLQRHRPKGGGRIQVGRRYYREATRHGWDRPYDIRSYP